jgi:hypothetical protein
LAEPVLGYGLTSYINPETINPGLQLLFEQYKNEIEFIRKEKFTENRKVKDKWEALLTGTVSSQLKSYSIGENLVKTKWHQYSPYNDSCPIDPNSIGERCAIGCNGVALGIYSINFYEKITTGAIKSYIIVPWLTPLKTGLFYNR